MLGLGSNLMYPQNASIEGLVIPDGGANIMSGNLFGQPGDEHLYVGVGFSDTGDAWAHNATGIIDESYSTIQQALGHRANGTFDFTIRRYELNLSTFTFDETTDVATVTGAFGYLGSILNVSGSSIGFVLSGQNLGSNKDSTTYDGAFDPSGSGLFDLTLISGQDITTNSILTNAFAITSLTYNPGGGYVSLTNDFSANPNHQIVNPS